MWSKSKSVLLSLGLVGIAAVMVTVLVLLMPEVADFCIKVVGMPNDGAASNKIGVMINLYAAMVPAYIALAALFSLLMNIRRDRVFIQRNVTLLRVLSYCCFAETVIFAVFAFVLRYGIYGVSFISLIVAFAAAFFGLIIRVIKNVFDKAIELREENDYTI